MAGITQFPIGVSPAVLVWPANGGVVTLYNPDPDNDAYFGYTSAISVNGSNTAPIAPLSSVTLPGDNVTYAIGQAGIANLIVIPGSISYSPGSLAIIGSPTVSISGTVAVDITNPSIAVTGTVSISGTPTVTISGTPSVTISGTPTVNLAAGTTVSITGTTTVSISGTPTVALAAGTTVSITGTTTVSISGTPTVNLAAGTTVSISGTATVAVSGNVNIIGAGGFISAGQLAVLLNGNAAAISAGPNSSVSRGTFAVETYNSIVLELGAGSTSSVATGAAVTSLLGFQWQDANGTVIQEDFFSILIQASATIQVPVKGSQLLIFLYNPAAVGTITYAIDTWFVWGDYREVSDLTFLAYTPPASVPTISGYTVIPQAPPVGGNFPIPTWISNLMESSETASTQYITFLSLWKGPVSGWYQQVTEALANDAAIIDLTFATQGNITIGGGYANGVLANLPSATQSNPYPVNFYAPPTQLAITYKTTATGGGTTTLQLQGG